MSTIHKIAIVTDTNSGMRPNETDDLGIFVIPMPFVLNGEDLKEYVNISREEFFERFNEQSAITTSQPSLADVTDLWDSLLQNYDAIIHMPTSSGMSNSFSTAQSLAKDYEGKVFLVDNKRLSAPLKESAFTAARLRDQGKTAAEIQEIMMNSADDYSLYFSLTTMQYLKKSGRISPAAAAVGSILKLRPVLHMESAKLSKFALPKNIAKAKEIMKNAIADDLATKFKTFVENGEMVLTVMYANCKADAELFATEIQEKFPNIPFTGIEPISMSVSAHTGPDTLAVACTRIFK